MDKKINIAVIGCSSIAVKSILPVLTQSDFFDLQYVGSRSKEKGMEIARQFNCKYSDYDSILKTKNIDAIYVSLPVGLHFEWGKKVLNAGKHLLLEKTFTRTLAETSELIQLGASKGLVVMEALMYVFHPLHQKIQALLEKGYIGNIRHIEAYFGFPHLPVDNIRYVKQLGGGAILDALVYPLSFCLNTAGQKPDSMDYNVIFDKEFETDARGFIQLNWQTMSAHVGYGFGMMYRNQLTIWGDEGLLWVDRAFTRPPDLPATITITKQGKTKNISVPAADHFDLMVTTFAQEVNGIGSTKNLNMGDNILQRMNIISEIYSTV